MLQQDDPVHKILPVFAVLAFAGYLVVYWIFASAPEFFVQGGAFEEGEGSRFSVDVDHMNVSPLDVKNSRAFAYVPTETAKREEHLAAVSQFETELRDMVSGYPIEEMIPFIAKQDRTVAAFLVGIAKKESDWGKHVPRGSRGEDCYNYWGYRGPGSLGVQSLGYGCFSSPEEAIQVVGGRIYELAIEDNRETPGEMVVWKCGSSCSGHSPQSVRKWISDVDVYYSQITAG